MWIVQNDGRSHSVFDMTFAWSSYLMTGGILLDTESFWSAVSAARRLTAVYSYEEWL